MGRRKSRLPSCWLSCWGVLLGPAKHGRHRTEAEYQLWCSWSEGVSLDRPRSAL